ncbi:MAG TPA: META domain-containing protein [Dongiaceae bacterium]|nr:META domain-containing protein [Dongiaceae bacterium]
MHWSAVSPHDQGTWRRYAVALALFAAGCASAPPPPSIVGLWRAQEIAGSPVPGDARITLSLYADGRAVGRAGCNNYITSYRQTGDAISFAPAASTRMACAQDIMTLEQSYLDALAAVTHAARQADDTLALTSDAGARILFHREEAASLQDARARGIDFRAAGQEPAWIVELKLGDHITAMLDYGSTSVTLPTPRGETAADGTEIYDATTDTDHLVLSIKSKICLDAMSGEPHPSTVDLTVNDKAYRGCGDWLD